MLKSSNAHYFTIISLKPLMSIILFLINMKKKPFKCETCRQFEVSWNDNNKMSYLCNNCNKTFWLSCPWNCLLKVKLFDTDLKNSKLVLHPLERTFTKRFNLINKSWSLSSHESPENSLCPLFVTQQNFVRHRLRSAY